MTAHRKQHPTKNKVPVAFSFKRTSCVQYREGNNEARAKAKYKKPKDVDKKDRDIVQTIRPPAAPGHLTMVGKDAGRRQ